MNQNNQNLFSISIVELIRILIKNKNKILLTTLIAAIITAIFVFFVFDKIYLSTATVKTSSNKSTLSGLISDKIPDLSDLGDLTSGIAGGTTKDLALYEAILNSRRALEAVVIHFNLMEEWEVKYMEQAVKIFRGSVMTLEKDKVTGTMEIGIYDKYPERAKEMVEFMINELNKINIELSVQNAKINRAFIEDRYHEAENVLRQYEDSLTYFQNIYGLAPDFQAQVSVKTQMELEIQIKSEEVKLEILRKILSPNEAEISSQEDKIRLLSEQLNEIVNTPDNSSSLSLKGAPDILMNYVRLKRNVEIEGKILSFIIPLYEQAKIEEKRDMPSVLILDYPTTPQIKSKPKRLTRIAIVSSLAFLMSFVFFVAKSKIPALKQAIKQQ